MNGPPGCGKDTAGEIVHKHFHDVVVRKFATALKLATHALYQVPVEFLHANAYEACKNDPHEHFFGLSPREAYIKVSEEMVKPVHGSDFFGRVLARSLREDHKRCCDLAVITDSGFYDEAVPVIREAGEQNVLLLRLHRPGCDFRGDSRGYLSFDDGFRIRQIDLDNDGDLAVFEDRLMTAVSLWLECLIRT